MLRTATVWLLIVISGPIVRAQSVRYVDDDAAPGGDGLSWATAYDTLPAALTAAQPGDQIWVASGTYVGNFTLALGVEMYGGFDGTETLLEQRDWTAHETILDGNQTGSVVAGPAGATEATRIDGFTITGGSAGSGGGLYLLSCSPTVTNNAIKGNVGVGGGGLKLSNSNATIANNEITGNTATHSGGGLAIGGSAPIIANNTITGNAALNFHGGGVSCVDSAPTITGNLITENSAAWYGGGLSLHQSIPPITDDVSSTIAGNVISGNSVGDYGGGLYLSDSPANVLNNTISGNSAVNYSGGGLYLTHSSATIANNTIKGNSATWYGGGLYVRDSSPIIANNTIAANSAGGDGGGLYVYLQHDVYSLAIVNTVLAFNSSGMYGHLVRGTVELRRNSIFGNDAYNFSGLPDPTGTDGNVSVDPLFVREPAPGPDGLWGTEDDDYGDLHLSLDSPVIDAGDNVEVPADVGDLDGDGDVTEPIPLDLDGYDRFMDDPLTADTGSGGPPIVDMGAYEFGPDDCRHGGGLDHDGDVDLVNYAAFERCVTGPDAQPSPGCECFDLDATGRVDLADVALLQASFTGE